MTRNSAKEPARSKNAPYHVEHETFTSPGAEDLFVGGVGPQPVGGAHLPDEVTRELARRMHYAAWRMTQASTEADRGHWHAKYLSLRDQVVVGNRKLIFRAVRRWSPPPSLADDMIGDCQIVLIQAVAAYNPWLGIRFSTYAFTCLMRALSRLSQRYAADRLARSLPLESLPDGEPRSCGTDEHVSASTRVDDFLREGNELLSLREKKVIARRFQLDDGARAGTLEQVGRELGLSKERVRQVQATALGKLRAALATG